MTAPKRHWRSYGTDPLPTAAEALDEKLWAFPSWFLRITRDRCGKDRMLNEAHASARQRDTPIRVLLHRMRHDCCGGRPGRWSCSPASMAPAAGQRTRSYCGRAEGRVSFLLRIVRCTSVEPGAVAVSGSLRDWASHHGAFSEPLHEAGQRIVAEGVLSVACPNRRGIQPVADLADCQRNGPVAA
jgi:hypothetical protein